jgi:hypothetical protein
MSTGNIANFDIRQLLVEVGGKREVAEPLSFYFARVARRVGISARAARAAWNREINNPYSKTAIRLREAAKHVENAPATELAALRQRIDILEKRLQAADPDFHSPDIDALRGIAARSGAKNRA